VRYAYATVTFFAVSAALAAVPDLAISRAAAAVTPGRASLA